MVHVGGKGGELVVKAWPLIAVHRTHARFLAYACQRWIQIERGSIKLGKLKILSPSLKAEKQCRAGQKDGF
jgi:hypothetical protein